MLPLNSVGNLVEAMMKTCNHYAVVEDTAGNETYTTKALDCGCVKLMLVPVEAEDGKGYKAAYVLTGKNTKGEQQQILLGWVTKVVEEEA